VWRNSFRLWRRARRAPTGSSSGAPSSSSWWTPKPRFIYRRGKNHFFAFDGFLMYCQQCRDSDFGQRVIDSIELTNYQWQT
jgi:hypothetical protein